MIHSPSLDIYYSFYLAVYRAHATDPNAWPINRCTRILTTVMTGPLSWRVIGITCVALKKFHELNYKYVSGHGITRAHLKPRIETVREAVCRIEPMPEQEFFEHWRDNDTTVLCARGENKTV